MDKRKLIGTIIGILLFVICIMGMSYAYYSWKSSNTEVSLTIEDVKFDFLTDSSVNASNIGPILDYKDSNYYIQANKNKYLVSTDFIANNEINAKYYMDVSLEITSISNSLKDESFKYVLLKGNSNIDVENIDNTIDTCTMTSDGDSCEVVKEGNFVNFSDSEGNSNVITTSVPIAAKSKEFYRFVVYIDGNIQNNNEMMNGSLTSNLVLSAHKADYCLDNNFNKLSDCMLVNEKQSPTVNSATTYIANKGSVDASKTAPIITYKETNSEVSDENGVISTTAHFTLGSGYTFDTTKGKFTLTNYSNSELTDDYIGYYTCGSTTGTYTTCSTLYKIKTYTKTTSGTSTTYKVTSATKYTYNEVVSNDSTVGLYETIDDTGTTYFYRGNVKNNYVSFAGFIWRIVRRNGNGTVRMIYSGTSTSDTGSATSIGTSQYNAKYYDPTYVGYKYSENFVLNETNTTNVTYSNINDSAVYYYGSSYTFNESTKKFSLSGNTTSGLWKDSYTNVISNYPYTCLSTSSTGTCNFLVKLVSYVNSYSAKINYISYSSINYEGTLENTTDSTIKTKIDDWYEDNLLSTTDDAGNLYSSYLSDEIFCNDRSINTGTGYLLSQTTTYGPYKRLYSNKTPSLSCSQDSDKFSVSNGNLNYPIALLTADEASLAGGLYNSLNTKYYLHTGQTYWTMSPSSFSASSAFARVWYVSSAGHLYAICTTNTFGVRPVINLSSEVLITGGDGTSDNPYQLSLE